MWDTAGVERYHSLTENYYRNAAAVLYIYSVDSNDSFLGLIDIEQKLKEEFKSNKSKYRYLFVKEVNMVKKKERKKEKMWNDGDSVNERSRVE